MELQRVALVMMMIRFLTRKRSYDSISLLIWQSTTLALQVCLTTRQNLLVCVCDVLLPVLYSCRISAQRPSKVETVETGKRRRRAATRGKRGKKTKSRWEEDVIIHNCSAAPRRSLIQVSFAADSRDCGANLHSPSVWVCEDASGGDRQYIGSDWSSWVDERPAEESEELFEWCTESAIKVQSS